MKTKDNEIAQSDNCIESWTCPNWSSCSDGTQNRVCVDSNNCGTARDKPQESKPCQDGAWCEDDGKTVTFFVPTYPEVQTFSDRCEGEKTFTDAYCDGNSLRHTFNKRCPDGFVCSYGVCVPEANPMRYGKFTFPTDLAGAELKIDGSSRGIISVDGYLTEDLPVKSYYIEVSKDGCKTHADYYENVADKIMAITINLDC